MPFLVIKGAFRLLGKTKTGKPTGFEPDGDSMQFQPDDPKLLDRLQREGDAYRLTSVGSTQLRFEGIDAVEIHFQAGSAGVVRQPAPWAEDARDHLTDKAGLSPVSYKGISVCPPAPKDGARGYILSRSLEAHGRPVAFVYAGGTNRKDGASVELTVDLLRKSLNWEMLASGQAYPLFYEGLFADLRDELAAATNQARAAKKGLWAVDRTLEGLKVTSIEQLQKDGVIFPKLFRRLAEFFGDGQTKLANFPGWLEAKREPVLDLDAKNSTHFDDVVKVTGNTVKLTKDPQALMFTSAKSVTESWM
jgi:endonuclease YncB( thermonuclease family)